MDGSTPTPSAASLRHHPRFARADKGGGRAFSVAALAFLRPSPLGRLASLGLALALGACAPDLGEKPIPRAPDSFAAAASFDAPAADWPNAAWWKEYGDPVLDSLIDEALADSPSLKIAAARLQSAQAEAGIVEADLWPTVNASAHLMETQISRNQLGRSFRAVLPKGWHHQAELAAGIGYSLDLFGKNRAKLAAATSAAEAAAADHAEARLQLAAGIAAAYASLVQLTKDRALAEQALEQRTDSAALIEKRFDSGLENKGALAMAQAQMWAAKTQLAVTDRLLVSTRNQIAALLGKGPDRGRSIKISTNRTLAPPGLPTNLTLNLIGRRPDIVAAKMRALAAAKAIDAANANFYPDIQLVGQYGVQSFDAKYLLTASSIFGNFGPAISLPLFDHGRLTGVYRNARAEYEAAVAAYDLTLTEALKQVATAYNNRQSADVEIGHASAMLAAAEQAYAVIRTRYKGGLSPYIDVLTAETQLIEQRRIVADLKAGAFAADVALKRALGGGYVIETSSDNQE